MTNIEDMPNSFVPGPGTYEIDKSQRARSPQFTMSGRTKPLENKHILSVPPPGQYKIPGQFDSPAKSGMTFGKRTKLIGLNNNVPGPGSYSPSTKTFRSVQQFSMSGRCKGPGTLEYDMKSRNSPSPDRYDLKSKVELNGKITLKSRIKDISLKPSSPGPAQYSPVVQSSDARKFSMAGRVTDVVAKQREKNSTLGPGSYNIPTTIQMNKGFSIHSKPKKRGVNAFCE